MKNNKKPTALLINPPIYDFALYDLFLKPYGLLRLGNMLESAGWKTKFLNALDYNDRETIKALGYVKRKKDGTGKIHRLKVQMPKELYGIKRHFARYGILPDVFKQKIKHAQPDVAFITSGMTYWYRGVAEAVSVIREEFPKTVVVVGGIYASLMPEHCYNYCKPDYVVEGSADERLNILLRDMGFPGIEYKKEQLPLDAPCWGDAAVIRLNEGCPFNCEYCASSKISPKFKQVSPEKAFNWLVKITEKHNTKNFAFYDDALLLNSEKTIKPFLRQLVEYKRISGRDLKFYTPNALHIKYIDEEVSFLMKQAGFRDIRLGFESESEKFHAEYDEKYTESSFNNAVTLLRKAGFSNNEITVYILAGLPRQKAKEVEQTIKYAANVGVLLSISEFSTVPGSALWDRCVKESIYPIAEEPLYHNNSFFPMQWEGFKREDMQRIKMLSRTRP